MKVHALLMQKKTFGVTKYKMKLVCCDNGVMTPNNDVSRDGWQHYEERDG